eukprot:765745-Hanusia_phi.AAC.3
MIQGVYPWRKTTSACFQGGNEVSHCSSRSALAILGDKECDKGRVVYPAVPWSRDMNPGVGTHMSGATIARRCQTKSVG